MEEKVESEFVPTITVGRYAGKRIDALPNSYLRWLITQDFPKLWLDCAKKKLEESDYNNVHLSVSRHAIDMFSKRFIHLWLKHVHEQGDNANGIASFLANLAEEAWEKGDDVSRHRHQDDGTVKEHHDIRFVFSVSKEFPDYKDVITVMPAIDQ